MSVTRFGGSGWASDIAKGRRPAWTRLRADAETDVVVIGGGLAGCTAAYVFAQAGVRVLMLEGERVGLGATASGPGLIDAGAGARFSALRERHGLRAARQMWQAQRHAALDLQALTRRLRIPCGAARLDTTDVAISEPDAVALEREHKALVEAGFDAAWLNGARLRAATGLTAAGALKRRDAGWSDPYRLAIGFARHAERRGATVYEQSPVRRVRFTRKHVDVVTAHATIRAAAVVVATGRPAPQLSALHRHLRAVDTTVAIVPSLGAAVKRAFGAGDGIVRDCAEPQHGWRLRPDGGFVLWQAGQSPVPERQRPAAAVQRTGQLMYELSVLFPEISGLQPGAAWSTGSYRSADGMVIAGPHRAFPHHLFAVGLGGDGLQAAYLAARINLRHYLGVPEPGDELFGFLR